MRPLLDRLLLTQKPAVKTSRNPSPTGFTLIELLIAILMGALVLIPLLGLVINVLDTDRKEQAKSMSEQELKDAADFITEDLKQAVYIYDQDGINRDSSTTAANSGIKNQIPPSVTGVCPTGATCTPVLVFWKREYFPDSMPVGNNAVSNCTQAATAANKATICDDAYTYSLVGYYLVTGPNNSPTWSRQARIARFILDGGVGKIQTNGTMAYSHDPDPGYAPFDMSKSGDLKVKMNQWTKNATQNFDPNKSPMMVLVDYIDNSANTPTPLACVSNTDPTQAEQRVPATGSNNFYACVNSYKNSARFFIRGNALERLNPNSPNNSYAANRITYFPTVTVQVQGRGFLFAK